MNGNIESPRTSRADRAGGAVVVALALAALDTVVTRYAYEHRPAEFALFAQSCALWLAYAALACVPAVLFERVASRHLADRHFAHPTRAALRLAAWTALPVLAHARLDEYTSLGGDLSALKAVGPWLQVAAIVLAASAAAWGLGRGLRRFVPRRVALATALLAAIAGSCYDAHDDEAAAARAVERAGQPNVLFLVWDTTRAASLQICGYERATTPHLAALAEQSLVFENARSVSSYTLTSHLSMLTGVYPSHHGARMTRPRFNPHVTPSVAQAFREAGYRTGAFVGTDVLRAQSGVRFAFERYDDRVDPWVTYTHAWALLHDVQVVAAALLPALRSNGLPHWIQDFQRPAGEVLAQAREWIDADDPRPWLCFVNLYDVHWPYLPEPSARAKWVGAYDGIVDGYSKRGDRVQTTKHEFDDADRRHLTELYDAELSELDARVDAFLARLDLARTGVLITADHGEAFGEGGEYEHANILECQTRVPLLVRPAGGTPPRVVTAPVSGIDVAPTLLALAGLPTTGGKPDSESSSAMTGRSLLDEPDPARVLLVEDRDHFNAKYVKLALYEGRWKLVRFGLPPAVEWHLYDVSADSDEQTDLAAQHPDVVERLRARLEALRATWHADDARDQQGTDGKRDPALDALGYADSADKHAAPPRKP